MTASSRRDAVPAVSTILRDSIPALCAPYTDQAAPTGSPEWFVAVAAANLRDAARLLDDCLRDAGRYIDDRP